MPKMSSCVIAKEAPSQILSIDFHTIKLTDNIFLSLGCDSLDWIDSLASIESTFANLVPERFHFQLAEEFSRLSNESSESNCQHATVMWLCWRTDQIAT